MEPFILRLVRDKANSDKDDIIRISFLSRGNYQIKTKYSEGMTSIQTLTDRDVLIYVHSLMILLIHDIAPFNCVQIDAPNTPSVLLAVKDLDNERIYQAIDNLLLITLSIWSRAT